VKTRTRPAHETSPAGTCDLLGSTAPALAEWRKVQLEASAQTWQCSREHFDGHRPSRMIRTPALLACRVARVTAAVVSMNRARCQADSDAAAMDPASSSRPLLRPVRRTFEGDAINLATGIFFTVVRILIFLSPIALVPRGAHASRGPHGGASLEQGGRGDRAIAGPGCAGAGQVGRMPR